VSANALEKGGLTISFVCFFTKTSGNSLQEIAGSISISKKLTPTQTKGHLRCLVIMAMSFCALPQELGHRVWRQALKVAFFRWIILGDCPEDKLNGKLSGNMKIPNTLVVFFLVGFGYSP